MTASRKALFRVDASAIIGSGHLMRCLTLAKALQQSGWCITVACRAHPGNLIQWLHDQGFDVLELTAPTQTTTTGYAAWLGVTEQQDAAELKQLLQEPVDLLVLDHYALSSVFEQAMTGFYQKLLVIDDLANRPHQCDYLLDQNLYPQLHSRYERLVNKEAQLLLGPFYVLLRPEFATFQRTAKAEQLRFLVFYGGTDELNLTALSIDALQQLQKTDFHADIVIGLANPHKFELEKRCVKDSRFTLHINTPQMAELMSQATLMIGAGGSTHWERCALALPALVVTLAENQVAGTLCLADVGACVYLGHGQDLTAQQLTQAVQQLLDNPEQLQQMSKQAKQLVPQGGGCAAIVDLLNTEFQGRH
ncbi:MAG: UDP-2,4-diacetamido-2,4,6-trideoxy-beta-L-altropyranose hydrolase [Gammaproteobacteria bacterium]|nr:UDP-2,4-diacetamido-2,4,6-trideoxy-beta-L-altropyranose hydrolase [Gammaproteobacteria bacterium]MBU2058400.1 UDP-2,4-diacetamido-2,4,6-trideoxy-beta-L-altropyranose hydrolase [Gammaproteobacteria bacterium]MBU2176547.1 UDP-2,4-diacetamido-2,4,6-trideoxy-beta-L-altropyranose hydrolase [Gammaproteobacteria bacterium]MBU2248511.1 UDP-2,4-diacetamido-2,4,6-trideoxy-beta-L-altropyranose hydrolase [Gammaproteobacteria bacterium]MBU2345626.1 UDP-2,4-diacetamido-2,4,6-trideoxy-beta-L-altropyranose 